jgi:putative DNA primase/helicase
MDIKAVTRGILAIDEDGNKSYQKGIKKTGLFTPISNGSSTPLDYVGNIYIGEGLATMATVREMTGCLSIMAGDAGNLPHVAESIRNKFQKSKIIITGDWDSSGTGQKKAIEAARLVNGYVVFPRFTEEHINSKESPSDFNDVFVLYGEEAVKQQLQQIQEPNLNDEWPDPQPIIESNITKDYPINALPDGIRDAVEEVTSSIQCPIALTASSAIAVISLASQGLADVRRDVGLEGPISIYVMTIAESGERKTAVDKKFSLPILKWEEEQRQKLKDEFIEYKALLKAWEAEKEGVLSKIKNESKKGAIKEELRQRLIEIEKNKPKRFRVPRLLYGDATPEALAWGLFTGWHSGGILSNEAGIIFGSHGMGKESIMRNLSQLNVLWDGGVLKIDRKTSDNFEVKGARLSMGLAVQSDTVRSFFESSQGLARGIGFLARFLISNPTSTQGYRFYKEPSNDGLSLTAFQNRIMQILDRKLNLNENGEIIPEIIELSPEAKQIWVEFYNTVEKELQPGREMSEAKDIASKIAENAARLAACFHIYCDDGLSNRAISADLMSRACSIAAWHLYEGRKFLKEIAVPIEISNAIKLDTWLIGYCNKNKLSILSTREIQRKGPVRSKSQLLEAIEVLTDADRLKLVQDGKKKNVLINPKLLGNKKNDIK